MSLSHQSDAVRTPLTPEAVRKELCRSPHFQGRTRQLQIQVNHGVVTVQGVLPSFYLRQVMTSLLSNCDDVTAVVDQVDVVSSDGLSSAPREG